MNNLPRAYPSQKLYEYLLPAFTHLLRLEPPKKLFVLDHAISVDVHATGKWTLIKSTMATGVWSLSPFSAANTNNQKLWKTRNYFCAGLWGAVTGTLITESSREKVTRFREWAALSCLWMKTSFSIIKARESGDMPDQMC